MKKILLVTLIIFIHCSPSADSERESLMNSVDGETEQTQSNATSNINSTENVKNALIGKWWTYDFEFNQPVSKEVETISHNFRESIKEETVSIEFFSDNTFILGADRDEMDTGTYEITQGREHALIYLDFKEFESLTEEEWQQMKDDIEEIRDETKLHFDGEKLWIETVEDRIHIKILLKKF